MEMGHMQWATLTSSYVCVGTTLTIPPGTQPHMTSSDPTTSQFYQITLHLHHHHHLHLHLYYIYTYETFSQKKKNIYIYMYKKDFHFLILKWDRRPIIHGCLLVFNFMGLLLWFRYCHLEEELNFILNFRQQLRMSTEYSN